MLRRITVTMATLAVALTGSVAIGGPVAALDSSDIRLSAQSVNQGSPLRVQVSYLYSARTCKVQLDGPKRSAARTVRVRDGQMRTSLSTAGLPSGTYVVRVACGKDGKAVSDPVAIVPKGSPTRATCDVTDTGFSIGPDGSVSYGIQVSNRSPGLTAVSVKLAVSLLDGAGRTLATTSEYVMDIAPEESVYEGGGDDITGVASIRVASLCESSASRPTPRLRGQAQTILPRESSYFPTELAGTIANSAGFIVGTSSELEYVTRNAAGQITGGGTTYPDAFIPVGGTGTWEALSRVPTANVSSVDWVLDTEEE